jgi:hypothetical protein
MSSQSSPDPAYPVACQRCGGLLFEPISFCPHCGASARVALGADSATGAAANSAAAASKSSAVELPRVELPGPPQPMPLFASAAGGSLSASASPLPDGTRHWGLSRGAGLTLVAFAVLFGGFVLLHQFDNPDSRVEEMMSRTAVGTVTLGLEHPGAASAAVAAAGPHPAPAVPAAAAMRQRNAQAAQEQAQLQAQALAKQQAQGKLQAQAQAQAQARSQAQAHERMRAQARAEPPLLPPSLPRTQASAQAAPAPAAAPAKPAAQPVQAAAQAPAQTAIAAAAPEAADHRGKAVPRDLQSIQASLQKNDLTDARAALNDVIAAQPDNPDAQRIRQELQTREQARDAALRTARGCAQQGQWTCVWHNAGDALSADTGSAEAKSLVARSIRESGWSKASPAPGAEQSNSQ